MQRFHQLLFAVSLVLLCWFVMMAVHEAGHVVGAYLTAGSVSRVVLYPLAISRTDVSHNPYPLIVAWLGPLAGCVLPLVALVVFRLLRLQHSNIVQFFAGFCLIANGAYIAGGSLGGVGDCAEMLRAGTPLWAMWLFGVATAPIGLYLWHRLGSLAQFFNAPSVVIAKLAYATFCTLILLIIAEFALSPR